MGEVGFDLLQTQLARQLRDARLRAGLSQEALALQAEVDRSYVSQLERGLANPSLLILHRIAGVLGAELQVLLVPGRVDR